MESANRVLTRKALDVLKSIAIGEYKPPEEAPAEIAAGEETTPETEAAEDQKLLLLRNRLRLRFPAEAGSEAEEKPE